MCRPLFLRWLGLCRTACFYGELFCELICIYAIITVRLAEFLFKEEKEAYNVELAGLS